jgi:hypothetical protein
MDHCPSSGNLKIPTTSVKAGLSDPGIRTGPLKMLYRTTPKIKFIKSFIKNGK